MERKRTFNAFKQAKDLTSFDEYPSLPDDVDVQLHLSRNSRPQPFFLICQHDTVLAQLSGKAAVEFKHAEIGLESMQVGDFVYVPAGTPHRVVPLSESVQIRYKAQNPGLEGVAWYCAGCDEEVWRVEWDTAEELPQEGYLRACEEFNASATQRRCRGCGAEHPVVDLSGLRWKEVSAELRSENK